MLVTVGKGVKVEDVVKATQVALNRAFDGNIEVQWDKISERRARVRLWANDPDGPGSRTAYSGRRIHSASWEAFGVAVLAMLRAGATRVQTAFAIYRSEEDFWRKAEQVGDKNVGSILAPVRLKDLSNKPCGLDHALELAGLIGNSGGVSVM